jgi:iron complex transport system substrate-binding protein
MIEPSRRICSLLPSATEIVCALGLGDRLVGVTHECDYPPVATGKPQVTSSVIDSDGMSSREIDTAVRESLAEQATIYHLDRRLLDRLQPDLVLTQELCDVCAVGSNEVREVVATLSHVPQVVSLEPRTLGEVLDSILLVGRLAGAMREAIQFVEVLRERIGAVSRAVAGQRVTSVLTLEWIDPVFVGGHWVPEMVARAGGRDVLGVAGHPSREVSWPEVVASAPEVVVLMPCGFGLERSIEEFRKANFPPEWQQLPAVRHDRVYAVDGSSYFNRPGPRLVDGVEILGSILHPEVFASAPAGAFARIGMSSASSAAR